MNIESAASSSAREGATRMMMWNKHLSLATASVALLITVTLNAQEKSSTPEKYPVAYELNRETTLIGTVVAFIQSAKTPPFGPRLSLQTNSGPIDIHLGDERILEANHFQISAGDTLRIIGENVAYSSGTQFVARILQKGSQALTVRSIRGIPLSYGKVPSVSSLKRGTAQ
jgi:hypothetical protein